MSARTGFPFTASQWQELEHQAMIYKYMVSGIPIPPDLLFSIKRTNCLDPSKLFPHQQPHIGWSCFQVGLGRKVDPEPGRCRRTDGKKWRCSKEAYPDSKYCERHMHRGKNRSRKPVEVTSAQPTLSSITKIPSSTLTSLENHHHHHQQQLLNNNYQSSSYTHLNQSYLCSRPPPSAISLSPQPHPQDSSTHLVLDSASYNSQTNSDYRNRYVYGLKEEVDEHAFFSEPSGTIRSFSGSTSMDDSWQLTPLTISSSSSKQRNDYSYLQLQSDNQDHHNYLLGLGNEMPLLKAEREEEPQKTMHHFFDEWPPKSRNSSWLDLDDNKSSNNTSVSTTSLSISTPSSSRVSHFRYNNNSP